MPKHLVLRLSQRFTGVRNKMRIIRKAAKNPNQQNTILTAYGIIAWRFLFGEKPTRWHKRRSNGLSGVYV